MRPARKNNNSRLGAARRADKNNKNKDDPNRFLRPAFPGQPVGTFKILSNPVKLTTTVTTGVIASVVTLSSANVASFGTRFAGWEEGRIIKAMFKIDCFSATNPGRILMYQDSDDVTPPTLALAQSHKAKSFPASDVFEPHVLVFNNHALDKLQYATVAGGLPTVGYIKVYTDNAALGSSIVATDYIGYTIEYTVQFRGFSV
jgi:hypothetical protein